MRKLKLFSKEQVGNASDAGRQYSRPDSLSLVSRQSVLAFLLVLLTSVFGVGNVWGEEVSWTISGVKTSASYAQVNTELTASAKNPNSETGVWTAVSTGTSSYAASSTGAQLGASSNREFNGTITLSGTAIPSTATITSIKVTGKSNKGNYTITAKVGTSNFGTSINFNSTTASTESLTGSVVGNSIQLSVSAGTASKYLNISGISVTYTTGGSTNPTV